MDLLHWALIALAAILLFFLILNNRRYNKEHGELIKERNDSLASSKKWETSGRSATASQDELKTKINRQSVSLNALEQGRIEARKSLENLQKAWAERKANPKMAPKQRQANDDAIVTCMSNLERRLAPLAAPTK